jgi:hypothetical protein
MKRPRREFTEQEKADRALLSVMKDWQLKPGQMLLLGPKSVAALLDTMNYSPGRLTDKFIIERDEWCPKSKPSSTEQRARPRS